MAADPIDIRFRGDSYRLLMEQVIGGHGLPAIVRLLADMLGVSAVVSDEHFDVLHAFAPGGVALARDRAGISTRARNALRFDIEEHPQASTAPPTERTHDSEGCEYVVAPIVLPSRIVGYLWITELSGRLSPHADDVVSHAAAAAAMEMMRLRAVVEGESRVRNSFLEDLLTGSVPSVSAMQGRARFLGYDLRGEQVVFVLDLDHFGTYVAQREMDEQGIQALKERFRRAVDGWIPETWGKAMVWEHSDSIVILTPMRKDGARGLRERVNALRADVEKRLAGPSVSAGIGRSYADIRALHNSYREAEHALRIGSAISGPAALTTFEDLGAYRLLFHLRHQPELRTFCEETLGALLAYDEQHDSRLLPTLTAFLEMQGNVSQTARALHLHRNGLLYRLTRIEKIAGVDLENASERLALQIALLAQPLLRDKAKEARSRNEETQP